MGFPHLYECSICGAGVKVIPKVEGVEPERFFLAAILTL